MGQVITVESAIVGETGVFTLDRSLTGQDGYTYTEPPQVPDTPPRELARRLFSSDGSISRIHVLSNVVTVERAQEWDDDSLDGTTSVISNLFLFYQEETPGLIDEKLREESYNATISSIRAHNPDLWVMRVRPDAPAEPFKAGQYTTLGLGFWEERADEEIEDFEDDPGQREKMARRSYSVSSSIVDDDGNLMPAHPEDIEFYLVLVRRSNGLPALTPRLFKKQVDDRLYMGRKFTGRYTLDPVEPADSVVFLSTGTGEAPQNAMTAELLRTGHTGRILNAVCVRYWRDLAYLDRHQVVQDRWPNYTYLPLTTREPENEGNKVYIQDLILSGRLEEELGKPLEPGSTHVFLCGNPAMIGLPKWGEDGSMEFPETLGVCQILSERGFTIDHLKVKGNVHYEEYW